MSISYSKRGGEGEVSLILHLEYNSHLLLNIVNVKVFEDDEKWRAGRVWSKNELT